MTSTPTPEPGERTWIDTSPEANARREAARIEAERAHARREAARIEAERAHGWAGVHVPVAAGHAWWFCVVAQRHEPMPFCNPADDGHEDCGTTPPGDGMAAPVQGERPASDEFVRDVAFARMRHFGYTDAQIASADKGGGDPVVCNYLDEAAEQARWFENYLRTAAPAHPGGERPAAISDLREHADWIEGWCDHADGEANGPSCCPHRAIAADIRAACDLLATPTPVEEA